MIEPATTVVIVGTDTDVGKTWVAVELIGRLRALGRSVAVSKPVQSFAAGAKETDASILAAASHQPVHEVCPAHRWYEVEMAPPIAAEILRQPLISLVDLEAELHRPDGSTLHIVETVGGIRSPLAHNGDSLDLITLLQPAVVVLVAHAGLGTINHVRLTVEALVDHPTVVLLNRFDSSDPLHWRNQLWLSETCGYDVVVSVDALIDYLPNVEAE